jgi:hypothetical protein
MMNILDITNFAQAVTENLPIFDLHSALQQSIVIDKPKRTNFFQFLEDPAATLQLIEPDTQKFLLGIILTMPILNMFGFLILNFSLKSQNFNGLASTIMGVKYIHYAIITILEVIYPSSYFFWKNNPRELTSLIDEVRDI